MLSEAQVQRFGAYEIWPYRHGRKKKKIISTLEAGGKIGGLDHLICWFCFDGEGRDRAYQVSHRLRT